MQQVLVNIPSVPIFERVVRASADEVGRALGFSAERVEDLKLAVSEAVNNAIDHGNKTSARKAGGSCLCAAQRQTRSPRDR